MILSSYSFKNIILIVLIVAAAFIIGIILSVGFYLRRKKQEINKDILHLYIEESRRFTIKIKNVKEYLT